MSKPTGAQVAARAVAAMNEGITYDRMDCQAFVEYCVNQCGGNLDASGSNDMARNHVAWLGTIAEAKQAGYLLPGAAAFIQANDSGEPAKYRADGMGNFSHVGLYVGDGFSLVDVDKNGKSRKCDVVHSGQTMGRVAGSVLSKNAWTHIGLLTGVDYGVSSEGAGVDIGSDPAYSEPVQNDAPVYAAVWAANGSPVKMRAEPSKTCRLYWKVPCGATVELCGAVKGAWTKVRYGGRTGWMMTEFLRGE